MKTGKAPTRLAFASLILALASSAIGVSAAEIPTITDLRCGPDGPPSSAFLQWHVPTFDIPPADRSGGKGLVETCYDFRYSTVPLTTNNWDLATSLDCDLPVGLDVGGQVELELHESPYHEYGGVVASCDRTHMTVYLQYAYQPFPTICPVNRGIPGQKIRFEVWKNGTLVDSNDEDIYTTRPNGKAEWISGDLTDVYWGDGGEWFTIKAIWDGATIDLWNGTIVGADAITRQMDIHRFEGFLAAPYPDSWPAYGRNLSYLVGDVQVDVHVTSGAVSGDDTRVEVQQPQWLPPFVGTNPAVPAEPMLALELVQTGGEPVVQLGAPVGVTVTYPPGLLEQRQGLGESSLRAYRYATDQGQWLLIDPAATTLDRVAHSLGFPIEHLGLYALAAESDSDGDGLGDAEEQELGTLPLVGDTDGDGVSDGDEMWFALANPFDPLQTAANDQHGTLALDLAPPYCFIAARVHAGDAMSLVSNSAYVGPPLDASFSEADNALGVFSADAAWGDVDGDGDPDVVICGAAGGTSVTRTYENVNGDLVALQDLLGIENTGSGCLAWGDVDGDGDLDLALAGQSADGPAARLYLNDGDGNLVHDQGTVLTGVRDASLAWGDLDGDGDLDLAVSGFDGTVNRAVIYENQAGSLSPAASQPLTALRAGTVDWADLDGDSHLDLLMTGNDGAGNGHVAAVYLNDGQGSLIDSGARGLCGVNLSDVAIGDHDGDGDLDVAITGCAGTGGPNVARVHDNDGAANFSQVASLLPIYRSSCAWGDVDLDGDLDLALCGYTGSNLHTLIYENCDGAFTPAWSGFPGVREGSVHLLDVDRDGDLDFFMTGADWATDYARLYRNDGLDASTGTLADPTLATASGLVLNGNHPNPFNPRTTIRFGVGRAGPGSLRVHDLRGRVVRTLLSGNVDAGHGAVVWDGRDDSGRPVSSGAYTYRLEVNGRAASGRMLLIK